MKHLKLQENFDAQPSAAELDKARKAIEIMKKAEQILLL